MALVAGLLGWQVLRSGAPPRPDALATAAPTPTRSPLAAPAPSESPPPPPAPTTTPAPTGFQGQPVQQIVGFELVAPGEHPVVLTLDGSDDAGNPVPISGLPEGSELVHLIRARGRTLALSLGGDDREITQVHSIADGTTTARRVPGATGHALAPGRTDATFWVLAATEPTVHRWQERDLAGRLLQTFETRPSRTVVRGVAGGVLIHSFDEAGGTEGMFVWHLGRGQRVRSFLRIRAFVAASSTHLAWLPQDDCLPESGDCNLLVTDLRGGADVVIPLPEHSSNPWGTLSPDSTLLALALGDPGDHASAHGYLVAVGERATRRIRGAAFAPLHSAPLMQWLDDRNSLVLGNPTDASLRLAILPPEGRRLIVLRKYLPPVYTFVVRPAD